ncbi:phosphatase PAP2 family protein [Virgibacillus sp. NKC19-16]|uniref:phosphatase PAP2 family protein n=1 Tax=Virgibacillus salidurans TaxID=2831673 RepID=UPI001F36A5B0|nr:phosphatase PAP2 family protein [Virgibacillus sp. NKC19-16]UJL47579.1 phosphatase PAP2 family protein [Virgibacillus sp. NKC19-16]
MINKQKYIILFLFVLMILTVGIWIIRIVSGSAPYVDQWTRDLVARLDGSWIYTFFRAVTEFGSQPFLLPFTIIMALFLWWLFKDWLPALIFSGGTLISHLFNLLIKEIVERDRPSILEAANAEGYSFPSGHAMISMVCYGLLAYFLVKKLTSSKAIFFTQLFFAFVVFLIGISRYFINVHYLTDVVSGFLFGFLCLIGLIYLYEFIQKQRR